MPESWPSSAGPVLGGKKTLTDPPTGRTAAAIGIGQYEMQPDRPGRRLRHLRRRRHPPRPALRRQGDRRRGRGPAEQPPARPASRSIPSDVAHDVTYALTDVAAFSHDALDGGRPVASKTGTQNLDKIDDTDAWMVGYTPSISTAVWMGSDGHAAIRNAAARPIYGAGLPGHIWKAFMNAGAGRHADGAPAEHADHPGRHRQPTR